MKTNRSLLTLILFGIVISTIAQTNLIANWNGNGDVNMTSSYPDKYGWAVTVGTFNYANSTSGIRWSDVSSSSNPQHKLNGLVYTGRLLMVRWDGAGSTSLSSVYSYPVKLEANKSYKFSWIYEWWNNASVPVYTVGISEDKAALNSVITKNFTCSSTKNLLVNDSLSFHVMTAGTYYLTLKANSLAVLGAIGNLSIVEQSAVLQSTVSSIFLNYYENQKSFDILPDGSADSIKINVPQGINVSLGSMGSSGGTLTVSSADSTSVSGNIVISQGIHQLMIPIKTSFPSNFLSNSNLSIDTLTIDGAWCWFNDPRAIYYKGIKEQTYFTWVDKAGDMMVASYNHVTHVYNQKLLYPKLEEDDHDVPAIFIRKDGRLVIYFSKHTTAPAHRFISTYPEDISSWGTDYQFGVNVTYPYPFQVGDSIYVFYRGINWHPTLIVSSDNGETMGIPHQIITGGGDRPYARYCQDKTGAIHMAFTTGHPRNEPSNKIYYACFKNGNFYRADGSFIKKFTGDSLSALSINNNDAETVYNASNGKGWIWDITVDSLNHPVLVYTAFPTDTDHRYYYARWTGTTWFTKQLTNAGRWFPQTPAGTTEPEPNYSGGISLDYDNPSVVYLSKQIKGVFEILKFTTPDQGVTWDSTAVTWNTPSNLVNVRPIVPRHHKKGFFDVLWMKGTYIHYTNYNTSVVFKMDSLVNSLDSIALDQKTVELFKGNATQLNVSFYPFITQNKGVEWTSSDENVATVQNGLVLAKNLGTCMITVSAGNNVSSSCKVTVNEPNYISNAFFDFGSTTSPVAAGAIGINETTMMNSTSNYGWLSAVSSRDRGSGESDELRDFNMSSSNGTFKVLVKNGNYDIIIKQGDLMYLHDNMSVSVNGQLGVSGVTSALGAFVTNEFHASADQNFLEFSFADNGGSDANWVINSLALTMTTENNIPDSFDFSDNSVQMIVFDISGRVLSTQKLNGRSYYQVFKNMSLPQGVYLIQLQSKSAFKRLKMPKY